MEKSNQLNYFLYICIVESCRLLRNFIKAFDLVGKHDPERSKVLLFMEEIWKWIPNYEGIYKASNLGRIKSVERRIRTSQGNYRLYRERIIKQCLPNHRYLMVSLCRESKQVSRTVHSLIAETFLGYTCTNRKIVIDHIDNNPLNNRLDNLQIITNRENSIKDTKNKSGFVGVFFMKNLKNPYKAQIMEDGIRRVIGYYPTGELASKA